MLESFGDAELPVLIGLERALRLLEEAVSGAAEPLLEVKEELPFIGAMVAELLSEMPAPAPPLLELLPRGMKPAPGPAEEGELSEPAVISSIGAGIVVLWFFGRWPKIPMPRSAFPPAKVGPFRLGLAHPLNNKPTLHAPIRPTKGILTMVLSSPVGFPSHHAQPQRVLFSSVALAPAGSFLLKRSADHSHLTAECQGRLAQKDTPQLTEPVRGEPALLAAG